MLMATWIISSCSKTSLTQPESQSKLSATKVTGAGSENGRGSARPVYYDANLVTVNMVELSDDAAKSLIANNTSINVIYAYNDLDEPQDFNSVIDAIPTDGFNPLWLQKLIVFNAGFTPHQFFSDEEVLDAASGINPEITLVNTGEIYRCSVIGPH
jgi:NAD(P)-dependent dehydrogenase (short-subunit alcohol dehydrogenase family)